MKQITYARTGSLVLALVFALVLAGCPTDTGDSGKQSAGAKGLTITDIPSKYNGMYLLAKSKDNTEPLLFAAESVDEKSRTLFLAKISSGKAAMNIWKETNDTAAPYNGNDKGVEFVEIFIFRTRSSFAEADWDYNSIEDMFKFLSELSGVGKTTVDFTGGTGTGKFIEGSISDLAFF